MDAKMRNTIIGSSLGGVAAIGLCALLTTGAMGAMHTQAAAQMSAIGSSQAAVVQQSDDGSASAASAESGSTASAEAASGDSERVVPAVGTAVQVPDDEPSDSETSSGGSSAEAPGTYDKGETYHIEWGDTLSGISDEVGYSVQELAEINHIDDVDLIYADSAIRLPD